LCAANATAAMMMAPSNLEAGVIGAMAAITALLVLRARRQVCDWSPSAPFHWERKRAAMADLTANDVIVITDFDATLTTGDSEQCHDMVGSSRLLSDEFRKEFAPLLDWTTNANIDGVPWWDAAVRPTAPYRVHRLALAPASRPSPAPAARGPRPCSALSAAALVPPPAARDDDQASDAAACADPAARARGAHGAAPRCARAAQGARDRRHPSHHRIRRAERRTLKPKPNASPSPKPDPPTPTPSLTPTLTQA